MATTTNAEGRTGGIPEAMAGVDAVIALSTPGPDTIKKEWIKGMAKDAIVFACANPIPEIWPWEAKEAGARIVATGRSDFPNQVNNSLGFPAIFRGALDVRATTITDEMCIAAAQALAKYAVDKGLLSEEYLVPTMDELEVFPREAAAVGTKAVEQGVARIKRSYDELYQNATEMIKQSQAITKLLMKEGFIAEAPE
jgi:malate dehydrogenase (oxaloacetate-decarboxylating)